VRNKPDAFSQAESLTGTILEKINGLNKSRKKFIMDILLLFMGVRGRYNFLNLARYGNYSEQSYRNNFEQSFDYLSFNIELIKHSCSKNLIIAFDPSYIPKSGKHTDHLGHFWSGASGKALKGLEIGGLAAIDVDNNTAMSLEAIQTPSSKELKEQGMSMVDHYAKIIIERSGQLKLLSNYMAVDGYFAKHKFIDSIINNTGIHVVSKLRDDANLMYLYQGEQKKERGRPKQYAGKIDIKNIDKRRIRLVCEDEDYKVYSSIVWSPGLKREIKIAYVEFWKNKKYTGRYAILFSTDLDLEASLIYQYYKSRFQIEFLFRDAKQYCGLTHCQGRSENKLHFHFNASLTTVSLAKAVYYLPIEKQKRGAFSMSDIKNLNVNKIMADRIFSNLDLDLSCKKTKAIYTDALLLGSINSMAA